MGKDDAALPELASFVETATTWMRLSVTAPLPNGNRNGSTDGGEQNNVLRVLWRHFFHYKVKPDNALHVMSD